MSGYHHHKEIDDDDDNASSAYVFESLLFLELNPLRSTCSLLIDHPYHIIITTATSSSSSSS